MTDFCVLADLNKIPGASIDRNPKKDNPAEGTDPNKVNNFDYSDDPGQVKCPFAAHLRKRSIASPSNKS